MTNKQSSECPTVPSWDPAQRDLSHRSFPQSLSIMLLLFSSCRESPNNFLPIVWQTWLCARCPGAINQPSLWTDTGTLAAADHWTGFLQTLQSVQGVTCHHIHCCMLQWILAEARAHNYFYFWHTACSDHRIFWKLELLTGSILCAHECIQIFLNCLKVNQIFNINSW